MFISHLHFHSRARRRPRGFTLIEILIVIAIIALLTAILFPVFSAARENARRVSCISNLRQIGMGLMQYTQDYDEHNTRQWVGSSGDSDAISSYKWMDAIFPYVKSEQLFDCPSHALPSHVETRIYDKYQFRTGRKWGSYAANLAYYDVDLDPDPVGERWMNPFQSLAIASWEAPATTILAMDGAGRFEFAWDYASFGNPLPSTSTPRFMPTVHGIVERHLGMASALFCDGHAKAQSLDKLTVVGTSGYYSAFTIQADPN